MLSLDTALSRTPDSPAWITSGVLSIIGSAFHAIPEVCAIPAAVYFTVLTWKEIRGKRTRH